MRRVVATFCAMMLVGCTPPSTTNGARATADAPVLSVDRAQYRAGETIVLTLRNGQSHGIGYNLCGAALERRAGGEWREVQQRLAEVCTMELRSLSPGASDTYRHTVPSGLVAGEYRVRSAVESPLGGDGVTVTSSQFRITN